MERTTKALEEIKEAINKSSDPAFTPEVKQKISQKVNETKENLTPLQTDKWIYRCVVIFLGLAILVSLICTFFISAILISIPSSGQVLKIPDIFLAIGSAAVGALAGLLAPSPGHGSNE